MAVAVFDVYHAERIDDPGANRSRQVPKLENDDRASVLVVEPVVMALTARDGEELQAFALLLPAATAMVTFAVCKLLTAVSSAVEAPPPRLILATAGAM